MRRGNEPKLIYDETRKDAEGKPLLLGVNLSADYCAEHEWDIRGIKDAFGLFLDGMPGSYGLLRRQITRVPKNLIWIKFLSKYSASKWDVERGKAKKAGNLNLSNEGFVFHSWYFQEPEKVALNSELFGIGLRGAWSDDDFAAISSNPADCADLREIFDAFEKLNIAVCFSGAFGLDNPGLVFGIADRLP